MLSCFPCIQSCFQCVYPQDNVNNILGQFYCSKGRFPVTDDGKKVRLTTSTDMYINASDPYMRKVLIILSQKLLEEEFDQSPTGITAQESCFSVVPSMNRQSFPTGEVRREEGYFNYLQYE